MPLGPFPHLSFLHPPLALIPIDWSQLTRIYDAGTQNIATSPPTLMLNAPVCISHRHPQKTEINSEVERYINVNVQQIRPRCRSRCGIQTRTCRWPPRQVRWTWVRPTAGWLRALAGRCRDHSWPPVGRTPASSPAGRRVPRRAGSSLPSTTPVGHVLSLHSALAACTHHSHFTEICRLWNLVQLFVITKVNKLAECGTGGRLLLTANFNVTWHRN